MKAYDRLGRPSDFLDGNESLWLRAKSRDCTAKDIFNLGLARFRVYEAQARMVERQIGGHIVKGRIRPAKGRTHWLAVEEKNCMRLIKGEGLDFSKGDKQARTFFICSSPSHSVYACKMGDGDRERFELRCYDEQFSRATLARLKAAGVWKPKEPK